MAAERIPDGYLFELYRSYIGEPDSRRDVYVGFGLFLTGVGLAVVALLLFLWSNTLDTTELSAGSAYYTWVKHAFALGMLSLPALMVGIVVLLPADRRVIGVSIAGVAVTLVATGWFYLAYPENWYYHGDDQTVGVVATYAVGMAGLTASTGAALIAHYLELARQVEAIQPEGDETEEETYSDEEIRSDIDSAMEGVELSWGGVEKTEHSRLQFTDHEFEGVSIDGGTTTTRSSGVDAQVAGLKGLKGGEAKTATSSATVDDQTQKLKELRERQRAEQLATGSEDTRSRVANWVGTVLGGTRTRLDAMRQRVKRN